MPINTVSIKTIKENGENPRNISDENYEKLKRSIQNFPEMLEARPLVIDENNTVIGGNMRLRVLKDLGYTEVPTEQVSWTEEQKQEFIIKDNVAFGEWDWEALGENWNIDNLKEWGLDIPESWEEEEVQAEEDAYQMPDEEDIVTDIERGDIITIGDHKIMCGDATDPDDVAKLMQEDVGDMVFTDPLYGIEYKSKKLGSIMNDELKDSSLYQFIYDAFHTILDYIADNAGIYCWFEDRNRKIFQSALEDVGLEYKTNLIWNKGMTLSGADYQKAHENCIYLQKKGQKAQWYGDRDKKTILGMKRKDLQELKKEQLVKILLNMQETSTVWDIDRDNVMTYSHPTQKPVTLAGRAIMNNTLARGKVLDMFLGSGSTMLACHQLDRQCIGMELDPKYCQVVIDRMLTYDPDVKIFKNGEERRV